MFGCLECLDTYRFVFVGWEIVGRCWDGCNENLLMEKLLGSVFFLLSWMLLIFEALCMMKINLPGSVLEEVNLKKKK